MAGFQNRYSRWSGVERLAILVVSCLYHIIDAPEYLASSGWYWPVIVTLITALNCELIAFRARFVEAQSKRIVTALPQPLLRSGPCEKYGVVIHDQCVSCRYLGQLNDSRLCIDCMRRVKATERLATERLPASNPGAPGVLVLPSGLRLTFGPDDGRLARLAGLTTPAIADEDFDTDAELSRQIDEAARLAGVDMSIQVDSPVPSKPPVLKRFAKLDIDP